MTKFVTFPELPNYGVPRWTRQHLINLQRSSKFPRARQLSPNRIGWAEDEIRAWVASRPVAQSVADDKAA